jgi:glucose uptake protein GlcU
LLGILGIIALIIILIGGFKWMTAQGNEEGVTEAKKTISAGIIGLVIIFFAYAIVMFVFNVVGQSVTG